MAAGSSWPADRAGSTSSRQRLHESRARKLVPQTHVERMRLGAPHVARHFYRPAAFVAEHLFGRVDDGATDSLVPIACVDNQRADASNWFRAMQNDRLMKRRGAE